MNIIVPLVLVLQVAAVYLPGLSDRVLGTVPLGLSDWLVAGAAGLLFMAVAEASKWWQKKGTKPRHDRATRTSSPASGRPTGPGTWEDGTPVAMLRSWRLHTRARLVGSCWFGHGNGPILNPLVTLQRPSDWSEEPEGQTQG